MTTKANFRAIALALVLVTSFVAAPIVYAGGFQGQDGIASAQDIQNENGFASLQSTQSQNNLATVQDSDTDSTEELIYSGGEDGQVVASNLDTGDTDWTYNDAFSSTDHVRNVALGPDDEYVFASTNEGVVVKLDAATGAEEWVFEAHSDRVDGLAVSPNGEHIYTGSNDNTVRKIDFETGDEVWSENMGDSARRMTVSSDDKSLYVSVHYSVEKIDVDTQEQVWSFEGHSNTVRDLTTSPDESTIYSTADDGTVKSILEDSGDEIWEYSIGTVEPRALESGPLGDNVYVGTKEGDVVGIDAESGDELWFESYTDVRGIGIISGGSELLVGDAGDIQHLDASTGSQLETWSSVHGDALIWQIAGGGNLGTYADIDSIVVDQNGNPVPNATVSAIGVNPPNFDEELINELELEASNAEELLDELNSVPDDFEDFRSDFEDSTNTLDADEWAGEVDAVYPLVHAESDWGVGTTHIADSTVEDPRFTVDSGETIIISLWDPSEGGWVQNQIDQSNPGRTTGGDIVIRQIDPFGDPLDTETHSTTHEYTTSTVTNEKEHQAIRTSLSSGIYQVYPEGHPERAYTFTVGDPEDLTSAFAEDLKDEAGELSERASQLETLYQEDVIVNERAQTDENGQFELGVPSDVPSVQLQAYKGDSELIDALEEIRGDDYDPDNPPTIEDIDLSDLRAYQNDLDYNGSFYMPAETQRVRPEDDHVTVRTYRTADLPWGNMDRFDSIRDFLENQRLNETVSELETEYDQRFEEMNRSRLEGVYQSYRPVVETVSGAEDDYLESSTFSEIQDAEDLTNGELETETELMRQAVVSVDRLEPPDLDDDPLEIDDNLLQTEYPLPSGVDTDTISPEIHWADGTSEAIDEEYWSVESRTLGSDRLVIQDLPIEDDDPAAFDIRIQAASDEGRLDDRISGRNPAFEGDIPDIDAVDFSALSPGPDERVYVGLDTPSDSSYEKLLDITAFDSDGAQLEADLDTDRDRASFRTTGEGVHRVRLTVETNTGDVFTITESVRANQDSRPDPATIRAAQSTGLGVYAVTGEDLESARIDDGRTLQIDAIARDSRGPNEIHIHPHAALEGDRHSLEVNVLHGSDEASVNANVPVKIHLEDIDEGTLFWHGDSGLTSNPITWDGDTRYGEVDDRGDGKYVLTTITDESGSVGVTAIEEPNPLDSATHRIARSIGSIPNPLAIFSVGSLFTLIAGFVLKRRVYP